jgi:hypothetical protein
VRVRVRTRLGGYLWLPGYRGRPVAGMSAPATERYVDAREMCEVMRVSPSTVKRWVRAGMPSETWGMERTRRFLVSKCIAWAQARADSMETDKSARGAAQRSPGATEGDSFDG